MSTPPKISYVCPIPWGELKSTDVSRYCATCERTVYNLSAIGAEQRAKLLRRAETERICGSYFLRLSGEMVTPEAPLTVREARGIKQLGLAALSVGALALAAGCVTSGEQKKLEAEQKPAAQVDSSAQAGTKAKATDKADETVLFVGIISCTDKDKEYQAAETLKGKSADQKTTK